jgi:Zn-dependent peptidase ImmA (M78 family)/DNA-binding XRE family transcriptional regulator
VATTLAHVTPEVLRWARESIGYTLDQAAARIGVNPEKLENAERGDIQLTLRQAERAADVYERPLAALFLPEAPAEEPQEAQFRRLPGAPPPPWPPEMQALARRIRARQDAAAELYETLDDEPPWGEVVAEQFQVDDYLLATTARTVLGLRLAEQERWRDTSGYTPLRRWVEEVERLGVLVMQDGSMPVEVMRGFAAVHPTVPAIVVNTQDDPRARAWTVVHELGHLIRTALGLPDGPETEDWCEEFAGEVIMPTRWLDRVVQQLPGRDALAKVDEVALIFGVTPLAAAVRIARNQLMPRDEIEAVIAAIRRRPPRGKGGGGNYYRTKITRLGPGFIRLVFNAVDGQALTLSNAAGLLEAKVNNFDTLRRTLETRAEFE